MNKNVCQMIKMFVLIVRKLPKPSVRDSLGNSKNLTTLSLGKLNVNQVTQQIPNSFKNSDVTNNLKQ